jgi:DtxR family transcriptional regulator, Mn-dependent transcriptional regulator
MSTLALSPTLEDYLEAIFQIVSMHKVARSMEIAEKLNVKRSSVTIALRSLADKGLINYQVRSYVTLTEQGMDAARCVDRRHHILHEMFTKVLGLPEEEADKAACNMEHGMTSEVCRKMTAFMMAMKQDTSSAKKIIGLVDSLAKKIDCNSDCGYSSGTKTDALDEDLQNLNFLSPGEHGIVVQGIGSGNLKKRLQEMGIMRGQKITVVRAAPLDDPIEVKVKNFHLSLRRDEAAMILIKKEE